ncbi:MAG: SCO family protein, partial [Myxococcota bacterium]
MMAFGCAEPVGQAETPRFSVLSEPVTVSGCTLVDLDGQGFTETKMMGRTSLVAVGTTRTADVAGVLQQVTVLRPDVQVLFVSVDPRDDPAAIAVMLADAPAVTGLTGSPADLGRAMASLRTSWTPSTTEPGVIDHSTSLVVIGPSARVRGYLHRPERPTQVV